MVSSLESLHAKLQSKAPVAKTDVVAARTELGTLDPAAIAAKRDMLLDIRYRAKTDTVADEAKAELGLLQAALPTRDNLEMAKHLALDAKDVAVDAGNKSVEVGGEMFGEITSGAQEVATKAMSGDYKGALTHPLTATILSVMGVTWLSNKILGTKSSFLSNLFLFTGVKFVAKLAEKYSK